MRPFLASKRKLLDLLVLVVLASAVWFLRDYESALLFSFGFIWNWVAGQDLTQYMEGKSYRYTMLRFVINVQTLILSPGFIQSSPLGIRIILRSLPAGVFWALVIWFQDSELPLWPAFLGSLVYELSQWEIIFARKGPSA